MVLSDLDRDLLNRCLAGVDDGWESFIDRYIGLITHVVTTMASLKYEQVPGELRDDMVAEILLALVDDDFAILRRFRGQSSLGTYLVVVTRRIASRRMAKLAGARSHVTQVPSDQISGQEELAVENTEEVQSMLERLPAGEARAIRMFHLEHRSYSDIGTEMGIPENSVGPLLSKARQRLKGLREG